MVTPVIPLARGTNVDDTIRLERANPQDEPNITEMWIDNQFAKGRQRFGKFWSKCRMVDEFVKGEFDFPVTENGSKIRLGTAHSVIKTLVDHITPPFVDITVPPPGTRGQARAEKIEKFLRGSNSRLEQETPTRRVVNFHQGSYGVAWEKTEFIGSKWADFPEPPEDDADLSKYKKDLEAAMDKRSIEFPITTKAVNPQQVIWDTNNGSDPRWVIHFFEIDNEWIHAHFPGWEGSKAGRSNFIAVWTHSQVAYRSNDTWVMKPRPHGYKIRPWTMYWAQTGIDTVGNKPEDLYWGLLDGNFEMIRAESQLASQYLDIVVTGTHPVTNFKGPPGMADEAMNEYDTSPGAMNVVPQNVEIEIPRVPEPPQTIILAKNMFDEAIEANTAPSVTRGQRPSGASSGYETAVLSGIGRLNFAAFVSAANRGLQHRNEIILSIVENVIQDRVTVWGQTEAGTVDASIAPKDIRGHHVNFVQLNPTAPEERERILNLWSTRWREGFVDHDTALREGGVSNALEVQSKLLAEKFLKSEQIAGILEGIAAQRIPLLQGIIEASGATGGEADEIAQSVLDTQGATQLPNAGNFQPGNSAGNTPQTPGTGQPTTTRPVMPGSIGEADLVGRQISSPARTGGRRVPTSNLPAGR